MTLAKTHQNSIAPDKEGKHWAHSHDLPSTMSTSHEHSNTWDKTETKGYSISMIVDNQDSSNFEGSLTILRKGINLPNKRNITWRSKFTRKKMLKAEFVM